MESLRQGMPRVQDLDEIMSIDDGASVISRDTVEQAINMQDYMNNRIAQKRNDNLLGSETPSVASQVGIDTFAQQVV